jgi:hypothetical protein
MVDQKVRQTDMKQEVYITTGTADAYVITIPGMNVYDGMVFPVRFHIANNNGATLEIN